MFGNIISQVCRVWFPKDMEMFLFDLMLNSIKAHVRGFWSFLAYCIACNFVCGGIVSLRGCIWLCVTHFLEGGMYRVCFLAILKKGSNFCFWGWYHHIFNYVWYCLYSAVCLSSVFEVLVLNEEVTSCYAVGLWGMISSMRCCGFLVSFHWCDNVVFICMGCTVVWKLV